VENHKNIQLKQLLPCINFKLNLSKFLVLAFVLITFTVSILAMLALSTPAHANTHDRPQASYSNLPLSFEAGAGQTDTQMVFSAPGLNDNLFLIRDSTQTLPKNTADSLYSGESTRTFVLDVSAAQVADKEEALLQFTSAGGHVVGFGNSSVYVAAMDHMLKVDLVGVQDVFPLSEEGKTQAAGDDADIAQPLSRVSYPEAWEGVTIVYEGSAGSILKSSYYIDAYPKGMPTDQIRLRYNRPVHLDDRGNLIIAYATGEMIEAAPVAWQEIDQERKPVQVAFVLLAEREVGFSLGDYDREFPLVIDPTLTWNTFLGGTGTDYGVGIAVDGSGNVYVTGYSSASWGTPVRAYSSGDDAFVVKISDAAGPWYFTNWLYRQKITISSSLVDSDQTNFPYMVKITAPANPVFANALASGDDILFTDSDGTTKLDGFLP
jgi:hypothetical protein